jgi:hypothetical protein
MGKNREKTGTGKKITGRGNEKRDIFLDSRDREAFLIQV